MHVNGLGDLTLNTTSTQQPTNFRHQPVRRERTGQQAAVCSRPRCIAWYVVDDDYGAELG